MSTKLSLATWVLLVIVVGLAAAAVFAGINVGAQAVRYESLVGPGGFLEHLGNKGYIYRNEGIRELKKFSNRLLGTQEPSQDSQ